MKSDQMIRSESVLQDHEYTLTDIGVAERQGDQGEGGLSGVPH